MLMLDYLMINLLFAAAAAAAAKLLQSCPTLCDPIEGSQLGSSVPGILQARILESMGFSRQEYWSGVPLPSPRNNQTCQ